MLNVCVCLCALLGAFLLRLRASLFTLCVCSSCPFLCLPSSLSLSLLSYPLLLTILVPPSSLWECVDAFGITLTPSEKERVRLVCSSTWQPSGVEVTTEKDQSKKAQEMKNGGNINYRDFLCYCLGFTQKQIEEALRDRKEVSTFTSLPPSSASPSIVENGRESVRNERRRMNEGEVLTIETGAQNKEAGEAQKMRDKENLGSRRKAQRETKEEARLCGSKEETEAGAGKKTNTRRRGKQKKGERQEPLTEKDDSMAGMTGGEGEGNVVNSGGGDDVKAISEVGKVQEMIPIQERQEEGTRKTEKESEEEGRQKEGIGGKQEETKACDTEIQGGRKEEKGKGKSEKDSGQEVCRKKESTAEREGICSKTDLGLDGRDENGVCTWTEEGKGKEENLEKKSRGREDPSGTEKMGEQKCARQKDEDGEKVGGGEENEVSLKPPSEKECMESSQNSTNEGGQSLLDTPTHPSPCVGKDEVVHIPIVDGDVCERDGKEGEYTRMIDVWVRRFEFGASSSAQKSLENCVEIEVFPYFCMDEASATTVLCKGNVERKTPTEGEVLNGMEYPPILFEKKRSTFAFACVCLRDTHTHSDRETNKQTQKQRKPNDERQTDSFIC